MTPTREGLPGTVKAAAGLLLLYGVAVLGNALLAQPGSGELPRDFPRAVLRMSGMLLIAWGLWTRVSWAWWLGVVLSAIWALMGIAGLVTFARLARMPDAPEIPPGFFAFAGFCTLLLLAVVVLLLTQSARAAFKSVAEVEPPPGKSE